MGVSEHILFGMSEDTGESTMPSADPAELEKLRQDLEKAKSDYLYLLAEFDNFRKNSYKERADLLKYGAEKFIREFLGIFDNFERALEANAKGENAQAFREGVGMIAGEIKSLLQRFGVEEIKAEGEAFDPAKHEALGSEPRADLPAGSVARVLKKAYKFYDKLLRTAQVTVASQPPTKN